MYFNKYYKFGIPFVAKDNYNILLSHFIHEPKYENNY